MDFQEHTVHILEKPRQNSEKYHGRSSTLDHELPVKTDFPQTIIFTSTDEIANWVTKEHGSFFPYEFRLAVSRNLNGAFGCEYYEDSSGKITAHDSWSLFKIKRVWKIPGSLRIYDEWIQLVIFVRQDWARSQQLVIFLDCPDYLRSELSVLSPTKQNDPYIWHTVLIDEVKKIYDSTIWGLRGAVWDIEKYQKDLGKFQPQFLLLHDIARHISHSKEILDVALDTLDSAIHDYSMLNEQQPNSSSESACDSKKVQRQLYFASKSIRSTRFRCISLSERLQNEINLAFNIVSQRDSEVSVQLAKHSLSDNTLMKTVAIVSMVYLPGTFVSGIFGMNLFDFNTAKKNLNVSKEFWLYWLVTITLTLTTTCLWALYVNRDAIKHFLKKLTLASKKPQGHYSSNAA